MILDSENDRKLLLEVMSNAQIIGAVAPVFSDLMMRIRTARVNEADKKDASSVSPHQRRMEGE